MEQPHGFEGLGEAEIGRFNERDTGFLESQSARGSTSELPAGISERAGAESPLMARFHQLQLADQKQIENLLDLHDLSLNDMTEVSDPERADEIAEMLGAYLAAPSEKKRDLGNALADAIDSSLRTEEHERRLSA